LTEVSVTVILSKLTSASADSSQVRTITALSDVAGAVTTQSGDYFTFYPFETSLSVPLKYQGQASTTLKGLAAPYLRFYSDGQPRITFSPTFGSTTSTTTVEYSVTTDGIIYTGVDINITNLDNFRQFSDHVDVNGFQSGEFYPNLGDGLYQGTICLTQNPALTTEPVCENISYTQNNSGLSLSNPDQNATSTFGFMPNVFSLVTTLANKFPFNWMFETVERLGSLSSSTATTTIPTVEVDFGGLHTLQSIPTTTTASTTFVLFSAHTIEEVGDFTAIQAMRTLLSYILWFGFMLYSYRLIRSIIKTT